MEKHRICIIYTGGTIGMIPSERGYVPSSGAFLRLLRAIPDLYWDDMPDWDVVEFDPLLDSSDITVREWNQLGRVIAERYDRYDGFVVLHGTDTMAYSASALAFMLEGLSKPVIFTGSQIPLGQIRTDGRDNIINSMLIAASGQVHEVCIYFNGLLLRGCRSVKRSSDQFEAFAAPNDAPLAHAGIQIRYHRGALRPLLDGRAARAMYRIGAGAMAAFAQVHPQAVCLRFCPVCAAEHLVALDIPVLAAQQAAVFPVSRHDARGVAVAVQPHAVFVFHGSSSFSMLMIQ